MTFMLIHQSFLESSFRHPNVLIPHTPFISCLSAPNSPESLFLSPRRQICRHERREFSVNIALGGRLFKVFDCQIHCQFRFFGRQKCVLFRCHSIGVTYNNVCVYKEMGFGGESLLNVILHKYYDSNRNWCYEIEMLFVIIIRYNVMSKDVGGTYEII